MTATANCPIDLRRGDLVVSYHLLRQQPKTYGAVVVGNLLQDLAYVWGQGGMNGTPFDPERAMPNGAYRRQSEREQLVEERIKKQTLLTDE